MIKNIGWINHSWLVPNDIYISVRDRGLRFSDGIFETILIKENKPILLNEHITRLQKTAIILGMDYAIKNTLLEKIINEGIEKLGLNKDQYGAIRINYSRGKNKDRSINITSIENNKEITNLWIEFNVININFQPINAIISQTEKRNEYSILSQCKTFSYNHSIQALMEAKKKDFDDALLLNTKNELCCGTTFNLILRRNNEWVTPRKESGCLQGIMVNKLLRNKLIKEDKITADFKKNDIFLAINSLSCKQIKKIDNFEFVLDFDPTYFWDLLFC